jgi:hypothetical protein
MVKLSNNSQTGNVNEDDRPITAYKTARSTMENGKTFRVMIEALGTFPRNIESDVTGDRIKLVL